MALTWKWWAELATAVVEARLVPTGLVILNISSSQASKLVALLGTSPLLSYKGDLDDVHSALLTAGVEPFKNYRFCMKESGV